MKMRDLTKSLLMAVIAVIVVISSLAWLKTGNVDYLAFGT